MTDLFGLIGVWCLCGLSIIVFASAWYTIKIKVENEKLKSVKNELEWKNDLLARRNSRLKRKLKRWKRLAHVDPVTGALNRAGFNNLLERFAQRANNPASPGWLAVLLTDMDHFKQINDTHGHPVGDEILRFVAETMRRCVRPGDIVARIGGDEFAIILPGADKNVVARIGREVHHVVRSTPYQLADGRYINVSASTGGAATLGPNAHTAELLGVADGRLYTSKDSRESGRHEAVVDSVREEPDNDSDTATT